MKFPMKVAELEPGWLIVYFPGQKPAHADRPDALRTTLSHYVSEKGLRIHRAMPVENGHELVALMAWTNPPSGHDIAFKVHPDLSLPKEHLEAFISEAYRLFFDDTTDSDPIVIFRGGLAVSFERGTIEILPYEKLLLDDVSLAGYEKWRVEGKGNCLVVHVPKKPRRV